MNIQLPINVLLVDNDYITLELLKKFLKSRGYSVYQANNTESALKSIRQYKINLVITDWVIPLINGIELCDNIRKYPNDNYIYIIMLTSNNNEDALVTAMEAGVDDFLGKPFSPTELGARLHAAERVLALESGLDSRNSQLAEAYGQLSRELELAKTMQLAMLPDRVNLEHVSFDWIFEASSYVGGDIFDYFQINEKYLCFYLIDVAGHGVSAAMMAFSVQNYLLSSSNQIAKTILRQGGNLGVTAEIMVARYNQHYMQMKETCLYLTMIYGLIDTETGIVALVQAGHPPAIYIDPLGTVTSIGDGGLPIGIINGATYEAHMLKLNPGARLFLYSDGITDCRNATGKIFGQKRLEKTLNEQKSVSLEKAGIQVRQAIFEWKGGLTGAFEDDITLLSLEYH